MGKRSNFERIARDYYPTPPEAVLPLLPYLNPHTPYIEPCAGDGALIRILSTHGHICTVAYDIEPRNNICDPIYDVISYGDALKINILGRLNGEIFITNPPWDREILHPLIVHLSNQAPTWLLFDADWMHTRQSAKLIRRCRKIVSVGRVKWIPDSPYTGKDNCAWYYFTNEHGPTEFVGR